MCFSSAPHGFEEWCVAVDDGALGWFDLGEVELCMRLSIMCNSELASRARGAVNTRQCNYA